MKIGNRTIDHIVYCVHDLDQAILDFKSLLGVSPIFGGYHTTQGTKNALLNLGNQCYLELLAIDLSNESVKGDRWMGIDMLSQPQITRWALKSVDLESDSEIINRYNPSMGRIEGGSRKTSNGDTLKWGIAMPLASPEIEVIPFMTDWSESGIHPTDSLEDMCRVIDISLGHSEPARIEAILKQLSVDMDVTQSKNASIKIKIECPKGIIEI